MSGSAWVCPVGFVAPVPSPSWVQYLSSGAGPVLGLYARADGDDVDGERPRAKRGPQGRVRHAPRAQLAMNKPGRDSLAARANVASSSLLAALSRSIERAVSPRGGKNTLGGIPERRAFRACWLENTRRPTSSDAEMPSTAEVTQGLAHESVWERGDRIVLGAAMLAVQVDGT